MEETAPTAFCLSDLPENVINEILCRLPIKDAVGTGILSRFWRRRWESVSCLDFSNGNGKNSYNIDNIVVSHVLLLHSAPIRLFKAGVKGENSFVVHGWLASLSRRAASTLLTLCLSRVHNDPLLSILRSFPCLTYLELSICNYMTVGFEEDYFSGSRFTTALRTLKLDSCPLSGKFSLLISACPLLETLILKNIREIGLEDTHSEIVASNLKRLEIDRVVDSAADFLIMIISVCPLLETLILRNITKTGLKDTHSEIVASNLKWLEIGYVVDSAADVLIVTAPVLETAVIKFFCTKRDVAVASTNCILMKFLAGMPSIRRLVLRSDTIEFLGGVRKGEMIPICLNHLRFMFLRVNFRDTKQVLTTLCLLRCAPNLQELELTGYWHAGDVPVPGPGQKFWETIDREGLFDKLETLEMIPFDCVEAELDFIQFVLAEAQILKLMTIYFRKPFILKKVKKKLLKFPIISGQAQLQYVCGPPYRARALADATDTEEEGDSNDSIRK